MATNIFSPWSGQTYSYDYGANLGGGNSAYNIWGSQSNNPYIVFGPSYQPGYYNPNTGTPIAQPQPLQVSTGGDDSFPDTTPFTGSGYSFGGNGSNSWFGGGVAGPSTSPGYSGPYDQGNPLATGNQGFMNELGKAVNDYFSNGGVLGMAANAIGGLFGEPAANNDYNAKSYAQEVGVAEGAGPTRFSDVSVAQQMADAMKAQQANYTNGQLTGGVSYAGTGGSDNFGYGGDNSGYGESGSGFGGFDDGTDASDAAAANQGEEDSGGSGYAGNAGGGFW